MSKLFIIWNQLASFVRKRFISIKKTVILRIHKCEHKAVLKALLSKNDGTDFNTTDSLGWTPMHRAIKLANVDIVKRLIDNGADVNLVDDLNWTPIQMAIHNDNIEIIKVLLQNGANPNLYQEGFISPLNRAIHFEKLEIMLMLIYLMVLIGLR